MRFLYNDFPRKTKPYITDIILRSLRFWICYWSWCTFKLDTNQFLMKVTKFCHYTTQRQLNLHTLMNRVLCHAPITVHVKSEPYWIDPMSQMKFSGQLSASTSKAKVMEIRWALLLLKHANGHDLSVVRSCNELSWVTLQLTVSPACSFWHWDILGLMIRF
jgi:hypothetical protein